MKLPRASRRAALLLGLVAALPLSGVGAGTSADATPGVAGHAVRPAHSAAATRPTVVLVHGADADSSSWEQVILRLEEKGYPVIAFANPLRSVAGDAARLSDLLSTLQGPVVLVGHSYGGMVISVAAAGNRHVRSLVFVDAQIPLPGETAAQLTNKYPGSQYAAALVARPYHRPGGEPGPICTSTRRNTGPCLPDLLSAPARPSRWQQCSVR